MGFILEIWQLVVAMSPYLLLGFVISGLLKVSVSENWLFKHLSGRKLSSVFKAGLIGTPLPLCSCSVIPVTAHFKRVGAGNGALLSFLTSAPTTSVTSMFATASLLSWPFAVLRVIAGFFIAVYAGVMGNLFVKDNYKNQDENPKCNCCSVNKQERSFISMLRYAFIELVDDTGKWIMLGFILGGAISYFVPSYFVENYLGNPLISYSLMSVIGLPMYVCSTGSIPIVASLVLKGMSPGAGLVFLIAGPATNIATMSFVGGKLGKKTLLIYIFCLISGAVFFGAMLDLFMPGLGFELKSFMSKAGMHSSLLNIFSAWVLLALILRSSLARILKRIFVK